MSESEKNGLLKDFTQELEGVEQGLEQVRGLLKEAQRNGDEAAKRKYQSELERLEQTRTDIRQKISDYREDIRKLSDD